ncbi:MAG: acetyl-CoA carboxylase biotin carboxyl carrier protein subunit [Saprospiraceae bacterium]|nr:acetyl-CoA carboxylase biotin carboxyl carrier protein subunit [Saprospiraceae bacterium]
MYQIKVNNQTTYNIDPKQINWDILGIKEGVFHIIKDQNSYTAVVLDVDYETKQFKIRVGSSVYDLELKDQFDLLAERLGLSTANAKKSNAIKAPMPGLVLDILVEEGAEVKKGDSILILEAMKMENVIKAAADGIIGAIKVEKGTAVEKNQVLVSLG